MTARILLVEPDRGGLAELRQALSGDAFTGVTAVRTVTSVQAAWQVLHQAKLGVDPVGVVVCDLATLGTDARPFLTGLEALAPDACLISTSDPDAASEADRAELSAACFAVLRRPLRRAEVMVTVSSALAHHQVRLLHREVLEESVPAVVEAFVESLAMSNPLAYRRTTRMVMLVTAVCERAGVPLDRRLRTAALISQLGCFAVPPAVLGKIEQMIRLPYAERRVYEGHLGLARHLLSGIPQLDDVARWAGAQVFDLDELQKPASIALSGPAACFDAAAAFLAGYDAGLGPREIGDRLTASGRYAPDLVAAVLDAADVLTPRGTPQSLPIDRLTPGMVLAKDVRTTAGLLLMRRGELVTPMLTDRLHNFAVLLGVAEPLSVFVPDLEPDGVPVGHRSTTSSPGEISAAGYR